MRIQSDHAITYAAPLSAPWHRRAGLVLIAALAISASGCQRAYYGAMKKVGFEKRDLLIDRVEDARSAQDAAKKQFESALAQFIAVTNFSGGELERQYDKLKSEYDDSDARAKAVRKRVDEVERVAEDLFKEWGKELKEYSDANLRRSSEKQRDATRARYEKLIAAMRRAEKKLDPVLAAFHDRVLYLKHNLNARAIASLRADRAKVEADIGALVADMNRAIHEADAFIKKMAPKRD